MVRRGSVATFAAVRALARSLPDVEEGTSWGVPAIKLRGRLLACMAAHSSAEPGTLVIRIGVDQRDAMIADDPAVYYVKPHYVDYPCVLVRLSRVQPDALRDLLQAAWRFVDASAATRRPRPSGARSTRRRPGVRSRTRR